MRRMVSRGGDSGGLGVALFSLDRYGNLQWWQGRDGMYVIYLLAERTQFDKP